MSILEFLSGFRTDILDSFFMFISNFGDFAILLPLICIIYWCISKSTAYTALFNFFITGCIVHGAKVLFRVPRPWILNPEFTPVPEAIETASGYSFPSGHTQASSSIFLTIAKYAGHKSISITSYVIVGLVALSRMYLGVHTPLDVFVSLIISIVVLSFLNYIRENLSISDSTKLGLLIATIAFCAGLCFYCYLLIRWNLSTIDNVSGSITFAAATVGFVTGAYIEYKFIKFGTHCHSIFMQLAKIILGLGGMVLIFLACKMLPFEEYLNETLATFICCIWATCIFPLFIKLVQKKKYNEL